MKKFIVLFAGLITCLSQAAEAPISEQASQLAAELSAIDLQTVSTDNLNKLHRLITNIASNQTQQDCILRELDLQLPQNLFTYLNAQINQCNHQNLALALATFQHNPNLKKLLTSKTDNGDSILATACRKGCYDALMILNNAGVTREEMFDLSLTKDQYGVPLLHYLRFGINCNPEYEKAFRFIYSARRDSANTDTEVEKAKKAYAAEKYCSNDSLDLQKVLDLHFSRKR